MKKIIFLFAIIAPSVFIKAQNQKVNPGALYDTIYKMDSTFFHAFNDKNLEKFTSFMDKGLEFYHDKSGLTDYTHNVNAFISMMKNVPDLKRTLLKETLEIYPVPGYGAVQIAQHRFCHMENGKMDCGVFKFIHVWKRTKEGWKVARIISVDH